MTQTIHPIFSNSNISESAQRYFTDKKFEEIIEDKIFVSADSDINEEAQKNWWTLSVNKNDCLKDDIIELFNLIISTRKKFLNSHHKNIKMIFYAWYDEQDGHLCFSLVQDKYEKLPFGCIVNKVDKLEAIIQHYFDDDTPGFIPWSELKEINITEEQELEDRPKYLLDVWSIRLE